MTQHFEVVYETKGVKVVNVWLAPDQQLPKQWNTFMEMKNWLENDYVKILIDYTNNVYDKLGDYRD